MINFFIIIELKQLPDLSLELVELVFFIGSHVGLWVVHQPPRFVAHEMQAPLNNFWIAVTAVWPS